MTIPELREQTIKSLNLTDWLGMTADYSSLSAQDQVNVTNAMNAYIVANPTLFPDADVKLAQKWENSGIQNVPLADTSLAASVETFGDEVANQAVSLNNNLNPFSEQNRKLTYFLIVGGVAVYFLGPIILKAIAESKSKGATP